MQSLFNKTILLTRSKQQIEASASFFKELGANVIEFPTIKIVEPDDWSKFDNLILSTKFDFIIFTSANSVKYFHKRLQQLNIKFDFKNLKVIAIGNSTAEASKACSIKVNFIPNKFSVNGLIKEFDEFDFENKNVLIPQSDIGKKDFYDELHKRKANVYSAVVYKNIIPEVDDLTEKIHLINNTEIDVFVFTSPSTFKNFVELLNIKNLKSYFGNKLIAAIGDTTKNEIEKSGLLVKIKPQISTLKNLANEIAKHFNTDGGKLDRTSQ
jgi:uroporphyrinogen-III synthase